MQNDKMTGTVNIQLSRNTFQSIDITNAVCVQDVKAELFLKTGLKPEEFDLLFCGKLLPVEATLKELNLGQGSVLHLYKVSSVTRTKPLLSVRQNSDKSEKNRYQYYVYCKECSGLITGKLRVRCVNCKQGSILLGKEPCDWDDVLVSERLNGHCTSCDNTNFAQFYFKCCEHDDVDECTPLRYVRPNSHQVECVTCSIECSPVLVYPCPDKHVICIDCFKSYAQVSLDQRSFTEDPNIGYSLLCPVGCEGSLLKDIHHFKLLGNEQYERYKDFGAEECLLQSGGILCPNIGCGEGMIVEDDAKNVQCRTCQLEFCRQCRQEVHRGPCHIHNATAQINMAMNVQSERAQRARWETASMETIHDITKPCPHCNVKTERNGGCMHMKCIRCHGDWCWLCEADWTRTCQGDHWFG